MSTATEAKRTVEVVELERDGAQEALARLDAERTDIEGRLETLFEDEDGSLEQAALSGKASGKGGELAKIRARLEELPALNHALRRRLLRLQIELTEMRHAEAEEERIAAIADLDDALAKKLAADDAHKMASGATGDAHWKSWDLQTGLNDLRQTLDGLEQNPPKVGARRG